MWGIALSVCVQLLSAIAAHAVVWRLAVVAGLAGVACSRVDEAELDGDWRRVLAIAVVVEVLALRAGHAREVGVGACARLAISCHNLIILCALGALVVDVESEAVGGKLHALAVDKHLVGRASSRVEDADSVD